MFVSHRIVNLFYDHIMKDVHEHLSILFRKGEFDINESHIIVQYPINTNLYESPCGKFAMTVPEGVSDEWFVYKLSSLASYIVQHNMCPDKKHTYGIELYFAITNVTFAIVYDPIRSFERYRDNISKDIFNEYVNVYRLFSNIRFYNHASNCCILHKHKSPKISISINGNIDNRPDIEYYVVFETSSYYTVQVFCVMNGRRTHMLFGVWIDAEQSKISEPYFIP